MSDEPADLRESESSGGMPETKWIVWTLFAMLLLPLSSLGGYFLWHYVAACSQAVETSSWPTVSAHIVSSRVLAGTSKSHRSNPEVFYLYRVGEKEFSSERIVLPLFSLAGSKRSAEATIEPFPTGSDTTAYYSPADPAFSVLLPGLTLSHYVVGLVMIAWVMVPIVLLAFFHRHLRSPRART